MVDVRGYGIVDAFKCWLEFDDCLAIESNRCRKGSCEYNQDGCDECRCNHVERFMKYSVVAIVVTENYIHIYTDEKLHYTCASEIHLFSDVCQLIQWAKKHKIPYRVEFGEDKT